MRACLKIIFSHLDLHDLPAVARVSREWCWNYWRDRDSLLIDVISKIYTESKEFKWTFYVNDPRVCQEAGKGLEAFLGVDRIYGEFLRESAKNAMEKKMNRLTIINEINLHKATNWLSLKIGTKIIPLSDHVFLIISDGNKRFLFFWGKNNVTVYSSYRLIYRGEFIFSGNYPLRNGSGTCYDESDGLIEFSGYFVGGYPKSGWAYSKVTGGPCYWFEKRLAYIPDENICLERGHCIKSEVSEFFWRFFEPGYATLLEPLCICCRNRRNLQNIVE